jgi:hypothetical protein
MRQTILVLAIAAVIAPAAQAAEFKIAAIPEGNVVEFHVATVAVPSKLPNYCIVGAVISKVWQGEAYRAGQALMLDVPCAHNTLIPANAWNDGFTPVNVRTLQQSTHGIARLDDKGQLMWHSNGLQQYGMWGAVAGYRVLDVRMLPAKPTQS